MTTIKEPTVCPSCAAPVEKVNDQLFCRNPLCDAQISGKLQHFCKVVGIKGLGPKTLEKLGMESVVDLYYLDPEETAKILGDKVSQKILLEIEKSKVSSLDTVLEAFSIPLIGGTAAKKVATLAMTPKDITYSLCKEAGLGEKATTNLLTWLETEYTEIEEYLPFVYNKKAVSTTSGKTVCITGKLSSYKKKSDAENDLVAAGYRLVDSVTKTTDILVDEGDGTSAKRKKAEQYGILIITDLNDLLKENKQ